MEIKKSVFIRRVGVVFTVLSLCFIVFTFGYYKGEQKDITFFIIEIISIILLLVSFTVTFVKTGLWGFVHKPIRILDEREIELTSKSLRSAYSIFTIVTLILLLSLAITNTPIDIVFVASLILFAHILPAIYIAWTSKEV